MSAAPVQSAMLMAAGFGTRMRPLTNDRPKPLIEVAGRTLIDRLLDELVAAGIGRAVVNVHYLADMLETHVLQRRDIEIAISDERGELMDTGGGVVQALPLLGDLPFLVVNTDAFWTGADHSPILDLIEGFDLKRMDERLLLARRDRSTGFDGKGDFRLDPDGVLDRPERGEETPYAYAGVRIVSPQVYRGHAATPFSANEIWSQSLAAGRLHGMVLDGDWLHVGDPQARSDAERHVLRLKSET